MESRMPFSSERMYDELHDILVEDRQCTQHLLDGLLKSRQQELQRKLEHALLETSGSIRLPVCVSEVSAEMTRGIHPMHHQLTEQSNGSKVDIASQGQDFGKIIAPHEAAQPEPRADDAMHAMTLLQQLQAEIVQTDSRYQIVGLLSSCLSSTQAGQQHLCMLINTSHLPVWLSRFARRVVNNAHFNAAIGLAILVNAIFSAMSTEMKMHEALSLWGSLPHGQSLQCCSYDKPIWVEAVNIFFAALFLVELTLRIFAEEVMFLFGERVKWNLFDTVLVVIALVDILVEQFGSGHTGPDNLNFVRIVWSLRVVRGLRIVRVLYLFKELRVVFLSLVGSVMHLFWAVLCLCIIMFVFIIMFMQGLADFVLAQQGGSDLVVSAVIPNFRSFGRTFCSLLMAITGGQDWGVYHSVLEEVSIGYSVLFVLYMMVMVFGVMNVITGIFVESAMAQARADFEVAKGDELKRSQATTKKLIRLFKELDAEMTGVISYEQWVSFVAQKDVQACFKMLHIDISRSADVFRLLDIDGSNEVDMEEFVSGCLHIQGGASSVDIEMLVRTTKTMLRKFKGYYLRIEKTFCQENEILTGMMHDFLDNLRNCGVQPTNVSQDMGYPRSTQL